MSAMTRKTKNINSKDKERKTKNQSDSSSGESSLTSEQSMTNANKKSTIKTVNKLSLQDYHNAVNVSKVNGNGKCLTNSSPYSDVLCDLNTAKINAVPNFLDSVVFEWIYNSGLSSPPRLVETKVTTANTEAMHIATDGRQDLIIFKNLVMQEIFQKPLEEEEKLKMLNDQLIYYDGFYNNDENIIKHLKLCYDNRIIHLQDKISNYDANYKKLQEYKNKLECLVNEQKSEILGFEQYIQKLNEDCSMFVEQTNRYLENESESRSVLKAELKEKSRSEKHLTQTIKILEKQCMCVKDELERVTIETTISNQMIINNLKESNILLRKQLRQKLSKEESLINNIKHLKENINICTQNNNDKTLNRNDHYTNESENKDKEIKEHFTIEILQKENTVYKNDLQSEEIKNKVLNEKLVKLTSDLQSLQSELNETERREKINKKITDEQIEKLKEGLIINKTEVVMEQAELNKKLLENSKEVQMLKKELKYSKESERICSSALEVTTKRLISATSDIEKFYKSKIVDLEQKLKGKKHQREIMTEKLNAKLYKETKLKNELEHEFKKSLKTIKKLQTEIKLYKNENVIKCEKNLELKNKLKVAYIDQKQLNNFKNKLEEQVRVNDMLVQKICEIRKKSSEEFSRLLQQLNNLKSHNKDIKPEFEHVHRGIKLKLDCLKQLKYLLSDDNLISRLNYSERQKKEFNRHVIYAIKMLKKNEP